MVSEELSPLGEMMVTVGLDMVLLAVWLVCGQSENFERLRISKVVGRYFLSEVGLRW